MKTFKQIYDELSEVERKKSKAEIAKNRRIAAKRSAPKRQRAKERKEKRRKTIPELRLKSRKAARDLLRKKHFKNYNDASPAKRAEMDEKLTKKFGPAIEKIVKKLFPQIKKDEEERLKNLRQKTDKAA